MDFIDVMNVSRALPVIIDVHTLAEKVPKRVRTQYELRTEERKVDCKEEGIIASTDMSR